MYPPQNQPWHILTYTYIIILYSKFTITSYSNLCLKSVQRLPDTQTVSPRCKKFTLLQSPIKVTKLPPIQPHLPLQRTIRQVGSLGEEKSQTGSPFMSPTGKTKGQSTSPPTQNNYCTRTPKRTPITCDYVKG